MQQKEVILEGTIKAFNEKGLKFTMDDVAKILGMSKKTIYTVFRDKESMFLAMVDYMFDSIKESEQQIVEDDALSTVEKIRRILGVIPESYRDVDFRQLYLLILIQSGLSYLEALDEVVSILVNGIVVPEAAG